MTERKGEQTNNNENQPCGFRYSGTIEGILPKPIMNKNMSLSTLNMKRLGSRFNNWVFAVCQVALKTIKFVIVIGIIVLLRL